MVRLLRLLRGYVLFSISGSYPEKLVNKLILNGINIWGVKSKEGVVYCSSLAVYYKLIIKIAKRNNVKVKIIKKRGVPFFLNKNKKRIGLPIGFICFLLIFKILSLFIWNIDLYGYESISCNQAKKVMKDIGFYEGAYANFDSLNNLQTRAMIEFGNVSWITVNVDGSRGEVNISEVTPKGEIKEQTPYNIKAAVDGQIIRVDAYSGVAAVKSGDAVAKGNLLISGFVETELSGTHLDTADGIVWARTERTESFSIPKSCQYTAYNPESQIRRSCRLFNAVIPLQAGFFKAEENKLSFISEKKLSFREETASISLINENVYFYNTNNIFIDKTSAEKIFNAKMMLGELFNYSDKKIISRTVGNSADENNYNYSVRYVCEEDIAEKSEILLDESFTFDSEESIQSEN